MIEVLTYIATALFIGLLLVCITDAISARRRRELRDQQELRTAANAWGTRERR